MKITKETFDEENPREIHKRDMGKREKFVFY